MLWPRIDQKTCLKAIASAGLEAVPLALAQHGDELRTDMAVLERELARLGAQNVVAVVTTTSCFAPRAADDVVAARHHCACICMCTGRVQSVLLMFRAGKQAALTIGCLLLHMQSFKTRQPTLSARTAALAVRYLLYVCWQRPFVSRDARAWLTWQLLDTCAQVARLCEANDVGHVINNAYGVQSAALCKLVRPLLSLAAGSLVQESALRHVSEYCTTT